MTHLPPAALNREDIRIPCTTMAKVWAAAMEQTGETQLAMRLGRRQMLGANRTTSLIMESSSTVLESFQLAAQYSVLVADVMEVEIGEIDDIVYVEFRPTRVWAEQPDIVQLDCLAITYLSAVASLQRMIGTRQPPSLLSLVFPAPVEPTEWSDALGCEVEFGADANRIGFPSELKSRPVATGDPGLKAALRRYADELRADIGGEPPWTREVMELVAEALTPQPPTLKEVAGSLGMSARTLQRLLTAEGQTFRRVVERVRIDLSERYLLDNELSVDRVAALVGYADTSSFVRAFKRCRGQPPRQFMQRHG